MQRVNHLGVCDSDSDSDVMTCVNCVLVHNADDTRAFSAAAQLSVRCLTFVPLPWEVSRDRLLTVVWRWCCCRWMCIQGGAVPAGSEVDGWL